MTTECVYCSLHAFCVHESSHIAICLDTECVLDRIYAFYGQLLVCCALGFVMPGLSFLRYARSDFLSSCPAPTGHLVHRLRFLRISLAIADLSLTPLRSNTLSPSAEKPDQRKITGGLPVYLTHSCTSGCWVFPGLAREPLLRLLRAGTGENPLQPHPAYPLAYSFRPQLTVIAVILDSQCQLGTRAQPGVPAGWQEITALCFR